MHTQPKKQTALQRTPSLQPLVRPHALVFDWRDTLVRVGHTEDKTHTCLEPLPYAHALLTRLHQHSVWVGLCSNLPKQSLVQEVEHLAWSRFFRAIIGAEDTPHLKPHPTPLLACLAQGKVRPGARIWFVGDTAEDMRCAQAAGCTSVLIRTKDQNDLQAVETHLSYPSLRDLLQVWGRTLG